VLGQMLDRLPSAIFVGELSLFWRRFANRELCSCGQALPDCRFWASIISKGFGELKAEDAQNLGKLEWALRRRQAIRSLFTTNRPIAMPRHSQAIVDARVKLYCAIASVAQAEWIVDSGKDPWLGEIFGRLFRANFYTVHIVRDPRGVAFSWMKLVKSDSEPGYMPRRHAAAVAVSWLIQNLIIQSALRHLSASYVRLRYEDLATDPETVVRGVAQSMGIAPDRLAWESRDECQPDLHWVAGNPGVRQSSRSAMIIKLDKEWQDRMPRVQRWLVTAICGVLFPSYGYPFSCVRKTRFRSRQS
jgi:Sulfotransferase family